MNAAVGSPWSKPQLLNERPELGPGLRPESLEAGLKRLAQRTDVKAIVAFGSRAREDATAGSDLDLLVISRQEHVAPEEQLPLWQSLRHDLGDMGVSVDLLVYGQREAEKLAGSRWHVLGHAARQGRVLYVAR